jgi:hypothetical protein
MDNAIRKRVTTSDRLLPGIPALLNAQSSRPKVLRVNGTMSLTSSG